MDMDSIPPEVLADLTIYNMPPSPPLFDNVGTFYMCFGSIWTAIVLSGMIFCWFNRKSPVLRHRGLPLSMAAITLLHIYWCLAQIVYPIGRTLPTVLAYDIQYFAMGIYFPLGIALFQAANSRFLHVAKLQKQYLHGGFTRTKKHSGCNGAQTSWLCRLRNMQYINKIMIFIGIGMIFQCLLTIGMWFACAKYHPTYGIPGTHIKGETFPEQLIDLGRGWEWWPSVVWQVIWTWMVAPYLLWRAWGIRDTMGWRAQTIGCCISGLHATPMFLISSYVPAFYPVNMYYPPSQWIHLSVMMIEIFTIFVPTYQVIRLKIQAKKAAASNDKWDTASEITLRTSTSTEWKKGSLGDAEKGQSVESFESSERLMTMSALDHVLTTNPAPLQEFSALSDFSGENIAFLTRVASWRSGWPAVTDDEMMLDLYNQALAIYIDFISPRDAEFPLNISSKTLVHLQSIFESATRTLLGEGSQNAATPFDAPPPSPSGSSEPSSLLEKAQYAGTIPESFGQVVFDGVESHIKYLVLTNTWPKFVEMQQRRASVDSERSALTAGSGTTLASRVSSTMSKLGKTLKIA